MIGHPVVDHVLYVIELYIIADEWFKVISLASSEVWKGRWKYTQAFFFSGFVQTPVDLGCLGLDVAG